MSLGTAPVRAPILALVVIALSAFASPASSTAASRWSGIQLPAKVLEEGYSDQVPLTAVSCPTEKLCVAVGVLDTVAVSLSPTGGRASWRVSYPTYPQQKQDCLEEEGVRPASCSFPRGSVVGRLKADACFAVPTR